MNREMTALVVGVVAITIGVLGGTELLLRHSRAFNRYIYENSSPRDSDHFRIQYRLDEAARELAATKIAFIGTSITRDGIDVSKFARRFPDVKFYNLGGTYKLPESEATFVSRYAEVGITKLVYMISGTDIFKLKGLAALALYPDMHHFIRRIDEGRLQNLWTERENMVNAFVDSVSYLARYRLVVKSSFENSVLKGLGLAPERSFDFFWQQGDILAPEVLQQKLRYSRRRANGYQSRLARTQVEMRRFLAGAEEKGLQVVLYHVNGSCDEVRKFLTTEEIQSEEEFGKALAGFANEFKGVRYVRAQAFPCEDYAEVFHLNERGREESFRRISAILAPELENHR